MKQTKRIARCGISFRLRRMAVKAHPDNRSHQRKWLDAVHFLDQQWIVIKRYGRLPEAHRAT